MASSSIKIKKAYVDLALGQNHYRYVLPATTTTLLPIVFLHKSASSSASYELLMKHYASLGHACYAPDMPGFGGSFDPDPDPATPYTTTFYCSTFASVFEQLGLMDPSKGGFHVVGHHSGAVLAIEMAVTYATVVKSISLIGASIMTAEERAKMKEIFFKPFNKPVEDGSHLIKTWDYLKKMGAKSDLELMQREVLDHVRAWRGRNQIYGAVWAADRVDLYMKITCPILVMCARDDVLWEYSHHVRELRPAVRAEEIAGANFSVDLDWEGCAKHIDSFIKDI